MSLRRARETGVSTDTNDNDNNNDNNIYPVKSTRRNNLGEGKAGSKMNGKREVHTPLVLPFPPSSTPTNNLKELFFTLRM